MPNANHKSSIAIQYKPRLSKIGNIRTILVNLIECLPSASFERYMIVPGTSEHSKGYKANSIPISTSKHKERIQIKTLAKP